MYFNKITYMLTKPMGKEFLNVERGYSSKDIERVREKTEQKAKEC